MTSSPYRRSTAPTTAHSGNDSYDAHDAIAIWYTGGIDIVLSPTQFASGFGPAPMLKLDLHPGVVNIMPDGQVIAIAPGTIIENVAGTWNDDWLIGNDVDNDIGGGLGGNDRSAGRKGNDTYRHQADPGVKTIIELPDEGVDKVISRYDFRLPANVENLTLSEPVNSPRTTVATGNELANVLIGNTHANVLIGGAGDDFLDGGPGMDDMRGDEGNDTYVVTDVNESASVMGITVVGP
jgi:Ca2+-binding RTX toxin-like protein